MARPSDPDAKVEFDESARCDPDALEALHSDRLNDLSPEQLAHLYSCDACLGAYTRRRLIATGSTAEASLGFLLRVYPGQIEAPEGLPFEAVDGTTGTIRISAMGGVATAEIAAVRPPDGYEVEAIMLRVDDELYEARPLDVDGGSYRISIVELARLESAQHVALVLRKRPSPMTDAAHLELQSDVPPHSTVPLRAHAVAVPEYPPGWLVFAEDVRPGTYRIRRTVAGDSVPTEVEGLRVMIPLVGGGGAVRLAGSTRPSVAAHRMSEFLAALDASPSESRLLGLVGMVKAVPDDPRLVDIVAWIPAGSIA